VQLKEGSGLEYLAARVLKVPEKTLRSANLPSAKDWKELPEKLSEMGLPAEKAKKIVESGRNAKDLSPETVQEAAAILLLDQALRKAPAGPAAIEEVKREGPLAKAEEKGPRETPGREAVKEAAGYLEERLGKGAAGMEERRKLIKEALADLQARSFEEALTANPELDETLLAEQHLGCALGQATEEKAESCALFNEALGQPDPKAIPKPKPPFDQELQEAFDSCYGQSHARCGDLTLDLKGGTITRTTKNEDGTTTQETLEPDGTRRVAVLNEKGRLQSLVAYDKEGNAVSETQVAYGSDSSSERRTRNLLNGGESLERYDSEGRLIASESRDKGGRLSSRMECAYRPAEPTLQETPKGSSQAQEALPRKIPEEIRQRGSVLQQRPSRKEPGCTQTSYDSDGSYSISELGEDFGLKGYLNYDKDGKVLSETTIVKNKDGSQVLTTRRPDGGSVKEFRDKNGRTRKYTSYGKDGKPFSETEYHYGREGEVSIHTKDLLKGTTTIEHRDGKGRSLAYSRFDKAGKRLSRTVFSYAEDGGVSLLTKNADGTSTVERRSKDGKTTEYAMFDADGKETATTSYAYDSEGKKTSETTTYDDASKLAVAYGPHGPISKVQFGPDGQELARTTLAYGPDGRKNSEETQYADGRKSVTKTRPNGVREVSWAYPDRTSFEESYDQNGALTKRSVYNDGRLQYTMTITQDPKEGTEVATLYPDGSRVVERRDLEGRVLKREAFGKDGKPLPGNEEELCLSLECRQARSHETQVPAGPLGEGEEGPVLGQRPPSRGLRPVPGQGVGVPGEEGGSADGGLAHAYRPPKADLPPTLDFEKKGLPFGEGFPRDLVGIPGEAEGPKSPRPEEARGRPASGVEILAKKDEKEKESAAGPEEPAKEERVAGGPATAQGLAKSGRREESPELAEFMARREGLEVAPGAAEVLVKEGLAEAEPGKAVEPAKGSRREGPGKAEDPAKEAKGEKPLEKAEQAAKQEGPGKAPAKAEDPEEALERLLEYYAGKDLKNFLDLIEAGISAEAQGFSLEKLKGQAVAEFSHLQWIRFRHEIVSSSFDPEKPTAELVVKWTRTVKFSSGEAWRLADQTAKLVFSSTEGKGWRLSHLGKTAPFPVSSNSDGSFIVWEGQGLIDDKLVKKSRVVRKGRLLPPAKEEGKGS